MTTNLLNSDFEAVINNGPVVIYFFISGNDICDKFANVFEDVSSEFKDYKFFKADADTHRDLIDKYGISNVPYVLILKDGNVVGRGIGAESKESLESHIKGALDGKAQGKAS